MLTVDHQPDADREIRLEEILADLLADGLITQQQVERLRFVLRSADTQPEHPLVAIAEQGWSTATRPPVARSSTCRTDCR